ncbi:MAG: hypothetical protein AAF311_12110 [Pseudomonadota bacterium]
MSTSFEVERDGKSTDRLWDTVFEDVQLPQQSYPNAPLSANNPMRRAPSAALRRESGGDAPLRPEGFGLHLARDVIDKGGRADIDISGPEFNFVRSIRVYDVEWRQYIRHSESGDQHCQTPKRKVRLGSYGLQGEFSWQNMSVTSATAVPWLGFSTRDNGVCDHAGSFRGVGVEWRDNDGNHGYEVVRY